MHHFIRFLIAASALFVALQSSGGPVSPANKGTLVVANQVEHTASLVFRFTATLAWVNRAPMARASMW